MQWFVLFIVAVALFLVAVYFGFIHQKRDSFSKFLKSQGLKLSGKTYKYAMSLDDDLKSNIMNVMSKGNTIMEDFGNSLETSIDIAGHKDLDLERFFNNLRIIRSVDPTFTYEKLIQIYECDNGKSLESFTRAWCDQCNAELDIDFDTALEFVKKGRDFETFVNLDIMAARAELEIDERHLINDIDDEGLKIIIYSIIRAKYEGIYMSEDDSFKINKANVLEYNDTFKITVTLLKDLYNLKRDVTRFTNVMIRAHNSGIRINFSIADLYSLSDQEFDNLVTNIIRASDFGISIDQKDLIRQNIQGNDITMLISALIKNSQCNLDLTPDELMNYFVNTGGNVVKFVNALDYAKKNKLGVSKDYLVEISNPDRDLFDFVQGLKIAKEYSTREEDYGITENAVKDHFKKFGTVLEAIKTVIKAREELKIRMNFGIAGKILEGDEYTLKSAITWALNPQVIEVDPCITCVCKNGVQVTPKVNITVRGKMEQIFWGYKLDVLFKRINEAIISEFESAESHDHILHTLPQISKNVLNRINEEENAKEIKTSKLTESELNKRCSYVLLDVNVYDIVIGQNIKAELDLREAQIRSEMRKLQAEADKAHAEAELRKAMVQQYKDGFKPNFNELHKANLLAEISQDINSGYEQPSSND
ncbi:MAG: flotillin-like FloA family protein [Bacteroidales bacterium]|nr:flotillin-like FloA family protein [Bacteroidales bacterium]